MKFEKESQFFIDTLRKCHINTAFLSAENTADGMMDSFLISIVGEQQLAKDTINDILGGVEDKTKYNFVNELKLHYVLIPIFEGKDKNLLSIGPYLTNPLSSNEVLEIGERLGFAPNVQRFLKEYYSTLPLIAPNDHLHMMIDAFCEKLWETPSFAIVDVNNGHMLTFSSIENITRNDDFDETLANIERLELRYSFENEMIKAVALGQQHKDKILLSAFDGQLFEKRVQDPVRNGKNYCIIMNTLLRKAAEQGGVHPLHIDRISSRIATKIEQLTSVNAMTDMMKEIFSSYCRLVRKHTTNKYSNVVKNTILMIESDISAELSLHDLAKRQNITAEYLATIFKKETGKTVIEYIRDKRINHALHLLNTTNLQIQTIAMHCGIMDVQYFSKIFKRQVGKTPREYRENIRR
ncbi:MAG: helix-turn-helix transcriptional regulator [Clostridia bacterium]|nr:helix-turn-helix transcriptional regulator [Clostridia bacterium]